MNWQEIVQDVLSHNQITQAELARRIKVTGTYINQLLQGTRQSPNFIRGLRIIRLHPNKDEILDGVQ